MMRRGQCRRFSRLLSEERDRSLTQAEADFMIDHRLSCSQCGEALRLNDLALDDLRDATINPTPSENFDDRILVAVREGRTSLGFGYWSPALIGAAIAGIAILSALTILTRSAGSPVRRSPFGEAKLMRGTDQFPALNLDSTPLRPR